MSILLGDSCYCYCYSSFVIWSRAKYWIHHKWYYFICCVVLASHTAAACYWDVWTECLFPDKWMQYSKRLFINRLKLYIRMYFVWMRVYSNLASSSQSVLVYIHNRIHSHSLKLARSQPYHIDIFCPIYSISRWYDETSGRLAVHLWWNSWYSFLSCRIHQSRFKYHYKSTRRDKWIWILEIRLIAGTRMYMHVWSKATH